MASMKFIKGRDATVFFSDNDSEYRIKRYYSRSDNIAFKVPKWSWEVSLMDDNDKYNSLRVFDSIKDAKHWAERHKNGTEG